TPGTARAWFCRGPCRALSGCFDGANATAPGDDESVDDGRWRSDLRRCDVDITPLVGMSAWVKLGGRTSASAECRHWSGRAVRWSSCAILLRANIGLSAKWRP